MPQVLIIGLIFAAILFLYICRSSECPHCKGTGELPQNGYEMNKETLSCPICNGRGKL